MRLLLFVSLLFLHKNQNFIFYFAFLIIYIPGLNNSPNSVKFRHCVGYIWNIFYSFESRTRVSLILRNEGNSFQFKTLWKPCSEIWKVQFLKGLDSVYTTLRSIFIPSPDSSSLKLLSPPVFFFFIFFYHCFFHNSLLAKLTLNNFKTYSIKEKEKKNNLLSDRIFFRFFNYLINKIASRYFIINSYLSLANINCW